MSDPSRPSGSDFQQALQAFRAEFAQQVPARVAEARDRLQACCSDPGNDALLRELHRSIHKLAGSAGTFGMARLGDAAHAIELQIETLLARGQRTAADFQALVPGVEALAAL
jgi:chemotaxis protein histidine kinase CheA